MPDAFLLLSYGAPALRQDLRPFLENIAAGRSIPPERMEAAIKRYERLGMETGALSPLPEECRHLVTGLVHELAALEPRPTVYWGNLFWEPMLADTVAEMAKDGVHEAVAFATSAFDSPTSSGRYRDALQAACAHVGPTAPRFRFLPSCHEEPFFLEAVADRLFEAMAFLELEPGFEPAMDAPRTLILFTAHSLPEREAAESPYVAQLQNACRRVMEYMRPPDELSEEERLMLFCPDNWELAFQSRGGHPTEPWLGPNVLQRLETIRDEGRFTTILLVPIGFFCENMETAYDLDREAAERCDALGLRYARARTVGASPKILRMIRETVQRLDSQGR